MGAIGDSLCAFVVAFIGTINCGVTFGGASNAIEEPIPDGLLLLGTQSSLVIVTCFFSFDS